MGRGQCDVFRGVCLSRRRLPQDVPLSGVLAGHGKAGRRDRGRRGVRDEGLRQQFGARAGGQAASGLPGGGLSGRMGWRGCGGMGRCAASAPVGARLGPPVQCGARAALGAAAGGVRRAPGHDGIFAGSFRGADFPRGRGYRPVCAARARQRGGVERAAGIDGEETGRVWGRRAAAQGAGSVRGGSGEAGAERRALAGAGADERTREGNEGPPGLWFFGAVSRDGCGIHAGDPSRHAAVSGVGRCVAGAAGGHAAGAQPNAVQGVRSHGGGRRHRGQRRFGFAGSAPRLRAFGAAGRCRRGGGGVGRRFRRSAGGGGNGAAGAAALFGALRRGGQPQQPVGGGGASGVPGEIARRALGAPGGGRLGGGGGGGPEGGADVLADHVGFQIDGIAGR